MNFVVLIALIGTLLFSNRLSMVEETDVVVTTEAKTETDSRENHELASCRYQDGGVPRRNLAPEEDTEDDDASEELEEVAGLEETFVESEQKELGRDKSDKSGNDAHLSGDQ